MLGLTNIYLKTGVLLLLGSVLVGVYWRLQPTPVNFSVAWLVASAFVSGAVLYLVGRLLQVRRRRPQT